jgi:hypothetical protein
MQKIQIYIFVGRLAENSKFRKLAPRNKRKGGERYSGERAGRKDNPKAP